MGVGVVFHSWCITCSVLQRAGLAGTDGARVLGAQAHQRMVTSMKKELATKEKRIEEVGIYRLLTIHVPLNQPPTVSISSNSWGNGMQSSKQSMKRLSRTLPLPKHGLRR